MDYVKIDYCGHGDDPSGHHNMSLAMNATGRQMVLALCRGPYQKEEDWGYAPKVAQVWRATGDHHDEFSSTMKQGEESVSQNQAMRSAPCLSDLVPSHDASLLQSCPSRAKPNGAVRTTGRTWT
eukprot:SAG22_NODE_2381_length_2632_cov_1.847217_2_plen_124_part_00